MEDNGKGGIHVLPDLSNRRQNAAFTPLARRLPTQAFGWAATQIAGSIPQPLQFARLPPAATTFGTPRTLSQHAPPKTVLLPPSAGRVIMALQTARQATIISLGDPSFAEGETGRPKSAQEMRDE
jgi:hypothetical protein